MAPGLGPPSSEPASGRPVSPVPTWGRFRPTCADRRETCHLSRGPRTSSTVRHTAQNRPPAGLQRETRGRARTLLVGAGQHVPRSLHGRSSACPPALLLEQARTQPRETHHDAHARLSSRQEQGHFHRRPGCQPQLLRVQLTRRQWVLREEAGRKKTDKHKHTVVTETMCSCPALSRKSAGLSNAADGQLEPRPPRGHGQLLPAGGAVGAGRVWGPVQPCPPAYDSLGVAPCLQRAGRCMRPAGCGWLGRSGSLKLGRGQHEAGPGSCHIPSRVSPHPGSGSPYTPAPDGLTNEVLQT